VIAQGNPNKNNIFIRRYYGMGGWLVVGAGACAVLGAGVVGRCVRVWWCCLQSIEHL
jgi:hypothetical protein